MMEIWYDTVSNHGNIFQNTESADSAGVPNHDSVFSSVSKFSSLFFRRELAGRSCAKHRLEYGFTLAVYVYNSFIWYEEDLINENVEIMIMELPGCVDVYARYHRIKKELQCIAL